MHSDDAGRYCALNTGGINIRLSFFIGDNEEEGALS
jgi:hypothetical protein